MSKKTGSSTLNFEFRSDFTGTHCCWPRGFQRKPIAVIDAYQYGSASQGHLILNGIFTASHFSISSKFIERTAGEEKLYLDTLNLPVSTNPDYPLERTNVQSGMSPKKNLVMIMIESLVF